MDRQFKQQLLEPCKRAVQLEDVLKIVKDAVNKIDVPIILFTYYNPIYYRGAESFLQQIREAGGQRFGRSRIYPSKKQIPCSILPRKLVLK